MWSSAEIPIATWNGSVCVVVAVGTSPIRVVSGASRAASSTASNRPRTWSARESGPSSSVDWRLSESSIVTKSSSPRSASATSAAQ